MGKFQDLNVWQRSKDLTVYLYKLTGKGKFSKDFGLRDQIRRASVSIASNIAEGDEHGSDKQSNRYFYIAKGSSDPRKEKVGAVMRNQIEDIAKQKFEDLSAIDLNGAFKIIEGTARSMGITIEGGEE